MSHLLLEVGIIGGLIAIMTAAAGIWDQLCFIFAWFSEFIISRHCCQHSLAVTISSYLSRTTKRSRFAPQFFSSQKVFVKPLGGIHQVAFEHIHVGSRWFWNHGRPVWNSTNLDMDGDAGDFPYVFSFVRGSVNWNELVNAAIAWRKEAFDDDRNRFAVHKIFGMHSEDGERGSAPGLRNSEEYGEVSTVKMDPVGWTADDIGQSHVSSLDMLSLDDDQRKAVEAARFWQDSELWYRERGIPWKMSFGFEGVPGSGKTSLSRALSEELNVPLYVIDLATMTNSELNTAWRTVAAASPAAILLEDVDSVFQGRENVSSGDLSFDGLLNCIDGADKSDGIMLFITTNNIEQLDPALKRPGRMDRVVHFSTLDYEGRYKLAIRILQDPDLAGLMAKEFEDRSAAEFQEACFRIAIEKRFKSVA